MNTLTGKNDEDECGNKKQTETGRTKETIHFGGCGETRMLMLQGETSATCHRCSPAFNDVTSTTDDRLLGKIPA